MTNNYGSATSRTHEVEVLLVDSTATAMDSAEAERVPMEELSKAAEHYNADYDKTEMKIRRFPASLRGLGRQYIVPMAVSIGPYHHGLDDLREMEEVKRVAAYHFSGFSERTPEEMYEAVRCIADDARRLYADDVVAGIGDADFAVMMFHDACFLLQFMLMRSGTEHHKIYPPSLQHIFFSNRACIYNDLMLLENQLPWLVVETLMKFRGAPIEEFIAKMGDNFEIHRDLDRKPFVLEDSVTLPIELLCGKLRYKIQDTRIGGSGETREGDRGEREPPPGYKFIDAPPLQTLPLLNLGPGVPGVARETGAGPPNALGPLRPSGCCRRVLTW